MTYKYFCNDITLKADIERHQLEQKKLESCIAELETRPDPDQFEVTTLEAYQSLLCKLLQSKAEVVSKIGKKGNA